MCFLVIRSMFLYFPYADLLFGVDGIAAYEQYSVALKNAGLGFMQYPFDYPWTVEIYLWAIIIVAFLYSMGIGKWIMGGFLYLLILNLQIRNQMVLDGSDNVILVTLPFLILADEYQRMSYAFPASNFEKSNIFLHIRQSAALGFLIQICIIYFVTGLVKSGCDVWKNGTANYYILQLDEFTGSKWNLLLVKNPFFVKSSTFLTLIFELFFPLAILFKRTKYLWLSIGVLFHVGIWVFMKIDVFPWIMIATYFVFITDKEYELFIDWITSKIDSNKITVNLRYLLIPFFFSFFFIEGYGQNVPSILNEIESMVQNHDAEGIAVGIIYEGEKKFFCHGVTDQSTLSSISDSTLFEIGSITKTFTTLALAREILKGGIGINDSLYHYFPYIRSPKLKNATLLQLATHSSGLPANPPSLRAKQNDPTIDFDTNMLQRDLSVAKIKNKNINRFRYSNFGISVLGRVLEVKLEDDYPNIISEVFFDKIGMYNSFVYAGQYPQKSSLNLMAKGHNRNGKEVSKWQFNALSPAGGIISCASDMLTYLNYCIKMHEGDKEMSSILFSPKYEDDEWKLSLGWFVEDISEDICMFWHNGGTNGFSSYLCFIPHLKVGVVALSNNEKSVDDFARRVLNHTIRIKNSLDRDN
jgi:CubicO group peptidase (beta-lactamase class C family)